jgi:hypothetical protein
MTGQVDQSKLFPGSIPGFTMPFFYASLQSFWLYYLVDPDLVDSVLPDTAPGEGLRTALFTDGDQQYALVSLDLQRYTGHGDSFLEQVEEVEFNVYAYPESRDGAVPLMEWQDYLRGGDQTKTIGGYRIHVPCSSAQAVSAGRGFFGEPKFVAFFDYKVPAPNNPEVKTWEYGVYDIIPPPEEIQKQYPMVNLNAKGDLIFKVEADLSGIETFAANPSPIIEYGVNPYQSNCIVANWWSFYDVFTTCFLTADQGSRVTLTLGSAEDKWGVRNDLQKLIANLLPVAAQTYESPIVSTEDGPWYQTPK